ncbi:MAG: glycosyltransferase [Firmicutes bacterium]|nr:glycosyltransferase [Bacillota bacterium]
MDFAVIIPAFNEGRTIGKVIDCALKAQQMDSRIAEIIVVDDGSQDDTALVAETYGVKVIRLPRNLGKGAAMVAGVAATQCAGILFLDGDLIGLEPKHLKLLIDPIYNGSARMTLGVFDAGRISTDLAQAVAPHISGQRAMFREDFLKVKGLEDSRFGVDIALTNYANKWKWPIQKVPLRGVTQVMKEEKYGFFNGAKARLKMYWDILKQIRA